MRPFFLLILALLVTPVACQTLEELAPPVSEAALKLGKGEGIPAESLHRGRRIYITTCAKCHHVEPIRKHSLEGWNTLLPEMTVEARLDAKGIVDLRAYILTTRRLVGSQPN